MPSFAVLGISNRRNLPRNDVSSSQSSTFTANSSKKTSLTPPSSSSSPCHGGHRVSFAPQTQIIMALHMNDYSEEERRNTWLNAQDLEIIKCDRKSCLRIMQKTNPLVNDDEYYYRGLESKTREGLKRKRFNVADAHMTVMEEQSSQEDTGITDPEELAKAYIACSYTCADQARQRGVQDELEALSIWAGTTSAIECRES